MAVTQARGIANKAKKHAPILQVVHTLTLAAQTNEFRFGGRLLRLQVGPQRRNFSAHEDMLCMRSKVFKDRFQPARKDVEGECVICHEDLDAAVKTLTYCKTCGNHLHQDCIKQWNNTNSTCPICRAAWVKTPFINTFNLDDTDADGFDIYVQWLYGRNIPTYLADNGDVRVRCRRLVKAHMVGENIGDAAFVEAVRREIIGNSLAETNSISVYTLNLVYRLTAGPCALRSFMIELCVLHHNRGNWFAQAEKLVRAALIDFTARLMKDTEQQNSQQIWNSMVAAGYIEQEV
ncbi:uncharacterized protein J4E79_010066 [Alternaria viburni]|uniref:uncharacterized protein n=1 Tax=Alternaria viburni TaxID=566460 RepID=UPI0020C27CE6|nr:uncharacterized protein J4E79_010066 [Alternaria viburni]KAI4648444.1 hypothetical protein J4E79_010066 [Alternaria viburni]